MTSIYLFALFVVVLLAGLSFFLFKNTGKNFLKLSLAFSGAFLLSLTVVELLPAAYELDPLRVGYFILLGYFFQIILEYFSQGIEHGHVHLHKDKSGSFPLAFMISLAVHSYLEGIPLGTEHLVQEIKIKELYTGIMLHHIPVAFALVSMLVSSGLSKKISIVYLAIFAAMCPLGAISAKYLGIEMMQDSSTFYLAVMGMVIGIFLHISTTILFESSEDHKFNFTKLFIIVCGAVIGLMI
ncbi:MAG: ZIP family metal transporter [Bacteroidia bacterium]|nr:ZIP family metal transporter [Bacteroidia bacterium]